jgi:hypothetical protein
MLAVIPVPVPGQLEAMSLTVIRRVAGGGRAIEFFVSEASVVKASGRLPKDVKHSTVEKWLSTPWSGAVGRQQVVHRAFSAVYARNSVMPVRRAEVMGLPADDPDDPWYMPLSSAVYVLLRGSSLAWDASAACHGLLVAVFHSFLAAETDMLVRGAGNVPETPPRVPALRGGPPASAPAVLLGVRGVAPPTPVQSRQRAQVPDAGLVALGEAAAEARAVQEDEDVALELADVNVAGDAKVLGPAVPAVVSLREQLNVAVRAMPMDDANTDVPLTASLGECVVHKFTFLYVGKHEIERRLQLQGHSLMLVDKGKTRGPWKIVYRGHSRVHMLLERFERRTVGVLDLAYTVKGAGCNGALTMANSIVLSIADCICTPAPLTLPAEFESVRRRVEQDRSLFPLLVRQDPSSGSASSFESLLKGDADIVMLKTLENMLHASRFNCAHCNTPCRSSLAFRRLKFRQLECYSLCPSRDCGKVTLFFSEMLAESQQLLRRAGAVASLCSFPSLETGHRYCRLMGLPNYSKLRLGAKRVTPDSLIAPSIAQLGQEHFAKQMAFHKTVADERARVEKALGAADKRAEVASFLEQVHALAFAPQPLPRAEAENVDAAKRLLKTLEDERIIAVSREGCELLLEDSPSLKALVFGEVLLVHLHAEDDGPVDVGAVDGNEEDRVAPAQNGDPVRVRKALFGDDTTAACGDGAHSRNTRANGIGHAPGSYVTIISTVTGAILIQVCIERLELVKARDASARKASEEFPYSADQDAVARKAVAKQQKLFVEAQPGCSYLFLGKAYFSSYVLSEAAGLDIALAILKDHMGANAMRGGLAYDDLTSCATTLRKQFPDMPKVGDPWHATKSLRIEIETLEADTVHGGAFIGLKDHLFGAVRENFKSKAKSVADKAAWARGWQFPAALGRRFTASQDEALRVLMEDIAIAFEATRPGFATSMVESYWSTHAAFWAKGLKYAFATLMMRMTFQALHWNRVRSWPQLVFQLVLPLISKVPVDGDGDDDEDEMN